MGNLKILIVDDEQPVRDMLEKVVAEYCDGVEVCGTAENVKQGIKQIQTLKPDILFLDINLPDGSGFDLLQGLESAPPKTIFITAYDDYAIQAFRISAVDYILKPINIDELVSAVEKCKEQAERETLGDKLKILVQNLDESKNDEKKLVLKTQESIYIVKVSDIVRCESDHNYTEFYLQNGEKLLVSKTLKEYDSLLSGYGFFRTHQSHLINLNCIARFDKADGGELILTDNSRVPVAVRKREELFKLFEAM